MFTEKMSKTVKGKWWENLIMVMVKTSHKLDLNTIFQRFILKKKS